jgi:hypothetical protein
MTLHTPMARQRGGKMGSCRSLGNVWEGILDSNAKPYVSPCNNCAYLSAGSQRVIRRGRLLGQRRVRGERAGCGCLLGLTSCGAGRRAACVSLLVGGGACKRDKCSERCHDQGTRARRKTRLSPRTSGVAGPQPRLSNLLTAVVTPASRIGACVTDPLLGLAAQWRVDEPEPAPPLPVPPP